MSDPEGFLREDQNQADYLNDLVGGPEAMEHAGQVGAFAAGHEVQVDDQSTGAERVLVTMGGSGNSQEQSGPSKDESPSPGSNGQGNSTT